MPPAVRERTEQRILRHAEKHFAGKYTRLEIRFRAQFCYIDAYTEPSLPKDWPPEGWQETREQYVERLRNTPTHLCRLRYFGDEERWAFAFFAYSSETVDDLLDRGVVERDPRRRAMLYRQAEREVLIEAPLIPLYHTVGILAVHRGVRGLEPTPLGLAKAELENVWFDDQERSR